MDPATLRADIPALSDCTYLNTGASGPSPTRVVDAISDFQRRHKFDAPCGEGIYQTAMDERQRAREAIAGFVGAGPDEIALTRNTVEGINHISTSIEWEPGDVVVRTDLEHPAGELPWERMADRHGIEVRELETEHGRLSLEELKTAVADARLLCLSSLSWNFGTALPIGEVVDIAHDGGTLVLVDAVQSPGQVPMDVHEWGADFVAASGHKWLLGAWGSGFLYIDRTVLDDLEPQRIGYFSTDRDTDGEGYTYAPDASRFELGTTALGPYLGLAESIALFDEIGFDTVQSRVERLTDRLKDGLGEKLLSPRGYESGLVSFSTENPDETAERLSSDGIQIRSIPEPHACRASVHVFNTAEDIDRLLDAL